MNLMVCEKLKTLNSQAGIVKFKQNYIQAYLDYLQYTCKDDNEFLTFPSS